MEPWTDSIGSSTPTAQVTDQILERPVPLLAREQALRIPSRIALLTEARQLTYGELDRRATALAFRLQQLGAGSGAERVIGVCLPRSPEFVIAALGIMKAGAAYLPLDPAHPAQRLQHIARDAEALLVVTDRELGRQFNGIQVLEIDEFQAEVEVGDAPPAISNDHLAYVIYTSGSTGQPKGVEVTHANLSHLVAWHLRAFRLTSADRVAFLSGIGFDAAVWDLWPALATGATLCLPNESTRFSAEALRDWLVAERITISFVPTAMAEQLIGLSWPAETALRFLLTGADTLHRYPAAGLPFSLVNNYGPTECTVVTTSGIVAPNDQSRQPPTIGAAIDRAQIHILDRQEREVPVGAPGEIYIGGAGVARGYRNHPELTAERFGRPKGLYRTGDLGRRLPNGEIVFLGRVDDQVKIRGHRIELGEVNAVLRQQPSVRASVVIAREDFPGDKRLVAYVVSIRRGVRRIHFAQGHSRSSSGLHGAERVGVSRSIAAYAKRENKPGRPAASGFA